MNGPKNCPISNGLMAKLVRDPRIQVITAAPLYLEI